ncbi:predicted protein [Nematostella vectensis]|uniref:Uncharacterized protein n=1 Tax=Nematostella vectensis TaxID=45351 RepID=A7SLY6_NEMVE|nr:predicted protein [Nematostella vectensis]|eukprot:XP_001627367.1 predicted protein [Nematostella vectensis]
MWYRVFINCRQSLRESTCIAMETSDIGVRICLPLTILRENSCKIPQRISNSTWSSVMPLKRSLSCEFVARHRSRMAEVYAAKRMPRSHSARKKSVQWSDDLEEVRYYIPHRSKSETLKRKIKKVRMKAEKLTDRSLRAFASFSEVPTMNALRCMGRQAVSMDTGFQSFEDYSKQWDLLFELYAGQERQRLRFDSVN